MKCNGRIITGKREIVCELRYSCTHFKIKGRDRKPQKGECNKYVKIEKWIDPT